MLSLRKGAARPRTLRAAQLGHSHLSAAAAPAPPRARAAAGRVVFASATKSCILEVSSAEEFDSIVAASKLPVVVDCSATFCGPCKAFEPTFRMFAEAYAKQAVFVSVQGDRTPSNGQLMTRLGVTEYPRFFIFREGATVASWTGINKQGFRNNLAQVLKL